MLKLLYKLPFFQLKKLKHFYDFLRLRPVLVFFFTFCLGIYSESITAQMVFSGINVQSPNVASLGTHGKVPVSLFTGMPNISVPLIELKGKSLKYQIELAYHPTSIKPNNRSGWVGQGWTLSSPAIYREVRGLPDEMNVGPMMKAGYYYRTDLSNSEWYRFAEGVGLNSIDRTILHRSLGGYTDTEPDIFYFNIMGIKGSFFLDHNCKWQIQSDYFVSIELDAKTPFVHPAITYSYASTDLISKSFNKFILKDVNGNKYVFGGTEATEYSSSLNIGDIELGASIMEGEGFTLKPTAWYLTEIVSPDLEKMNFAYERGPFVSTLYRYAYSNATSKGAGGCGSFIQTNWKSGGVLISPLYLKSVNLNEQSVQFLFSKSNELNYTLNDYRAIATNDHDYLDRTLDIIRRSRDKVPYYQQYYIMSNYYDKLIWMKLDSIQVKTSNAIHNTVEFSYNEDPTKRLFLDSIRQVGKDRNSFSYSFSYNQPETLPKYLTNISDHWGFYNAVGFSNFQPSNIFSQREPDSSYVTRGVLTEIKYPTGGKTVFGYEIGDYSSIVNEVDRTKMISETGSGGIRIATIDNYGNDEQVTERKKFLYKKNSITGGEVSSGILNNKAKYYISNSSGIDMSGGAFSFSSVLSNSINDLSDNAGVSIGYSEVMQVSYVGDKENYSIHTFTNHDNQYSDDNPTYLYKADLLVGKPVNSRAFERGRELTVSYYDEYKTKLKSTTNVWKADRNSALSSRAVKFNYLDVAVRCNVGYYYPSSVSYLNYYYPIQLESKIDSTFLSDGSVVNKQDFEYTDLRLLKKELVSNSSGSVLEKIYKYPSDYNNRIGTLNTMVERNLFNTPIEQIIMKDGYVLGGRIKEYIKRNDLIVPWKIYSLPIESPIAISSFSVSSLDGAGNLQFDSKYTLDEEVLGNDDYGNPIAVLTKGKLPISYQWGGNGEYLVAKVVNAKNDVYVENNSTVTESNTSKVSRKEFFYEGFEEGNLGTSSKKAIGRKYFIGDYTVPFQKPDNGKYIIDYRYFSNGNTHYVQKEYVDNMIVTDGDAIDEVRVYPASSEMTTYTYEPLIGITSKTDPRGITEFYDYDGFGRLSLVRDHEGNVLKSYCYNYKGQQVDCFTGIDVGPGTDPIEYKNIEKSQVFYKNDCTIGIGQQVAYTVLAGKYSSLISQADADQKANDEIMANGQTYANQNGQCEFVSVPVVLLNDIYGAFPRTFDRIVFRSGNDIVLDYYPENIYSEDNFSVPAGIYDVTFYITNTSPSYPALYLNFMHDQGNACVFMPQWATEHRLYNVKLGDHVYPHYLIEVDNFCH